MFRIFKKEKEVKSLNSIKVSKTIERPFTGVNKLSEYELNKMKKSNKEDKKVDPYFLQEIVDRICGPDSEEYKKEILKLNEKFKPRIGKTGRKIFE